jgi:predicted lipoprotein with Yx(FWY)xxD motif
MQTRREARLGRWSLLGFRAAGAALLTTTAAIHLDLYVTGYNTIPTIGWLFLLQVITGFALAAALLATGSRLIAALAAGFVLSTLGGYLLSVWIGLFGFKEVRTTAGVVAGIVEVAACAVLAVVATAPRGGREARGPAWLPGRMLASLASWRTAAAAVAAVSGVALVFLGVSLALGGGQPAPAASATGQRQVLKTATIRGVTVLTNAKGLTLYWFAPDTSSRSVCNGSCAAYWPPVLGRPAAGPGVTGKLATIKRSDGKLQATYNGHPLYTYIGDSRPGQANGNNLNLNGGLWHEVPASG